MAYPTGTLSLVLDSIDRRAVALKKFCESARTALAAGNVASSAILNLYTSLRNERVAFAAVNETNHPGITAYAREQKNDGTLDAVAEFQTMLSRIDAVTVWISTNFPKDAGGFLLAATLGADGPTDRTFTPAQTAGLRTALDALIAQIA